MRNIYYWGLFLCVSLVYAGTNNLPVETSSIIQRQHVNKFQTAFSGEMAPRDTSGNVNDAGSSLGASTRRWLNTFTKNLNLTSATGGNSVILTAPSPVPSPYTITMPSAPPSSTFPVTMSSAGGLSISNQITGSQIATGTITDLNILSGTITSLSLQDGSVTQNKRAALPYAISASSGAFSTGSPTAVDVTNLSVTITTTGRPVFLCLIPGNSTPGMFVGPVKAPAAVQAVGYLLFYRDATLTASFNFVGGTVEPSYAHALVGAFSSIVIDLPSSGSHTFKVQAYSGAGSVMYVDHASLFAFEL